MRSVRCGCYDERLVGSVCGEVLRPELAENPVVLESFVRERSVLLALSHPHIVPVDGHGG